MTNEGKQTSDEKQVADDKAAPKPSAIAAPEPRIPPLEAVNQYTIVRPSERREE